MLTSHDDGFGVMKGYQRREREDHKVDAHPIVLIFLKKQCLREGAARCARELTVIDLPFRTSSFRVALFILVETSTGLEQEFVVEILVTQTLSLTRQPFLSNCSTAESLL